MKKLFTNDKFFLATVLVAIFGTAIKAVANWIAFPETSGLIVIEVLAALCVLVLFTSYRKHSKNVMKCIVGALLMLVLLYSISCLMDTNVIIAASIVKAFQVLFAAGLFITHNLINSDHHSNAGFIRFNQLLCVLIFLCEVVTTGLFMQINVTVLSKVADVIGAIGFASVVAAIVCVESRLDAYRLDREAAGWTEEKGYPENYIHQYEKK